jgi:hypothetical protein
LLKGKNTGDEEKMKQLGKYRRRYLLGYPRARRWRNRLLVRLSVRLSANAWHKLSRAFCRHTTGKKSVRIQEFDRKAMRCRDSKADGRRIARGKTKDSTGGGAEGHTSSLSLSEVREKGSSAAW